MFTFYYKLKLHHTISALHLHFQTTFNISFQAHYIEHFFVFIL
jgi:hypothetical protein